MSNPSPQKLAEWRERAKRKGAIVPHFFEVWVNRVVIHCGKCQKEFRRTLLPNLDEPTFVCPNQGCGAKNWIPLRYDKSK